MDKQQMYTHDIMEVCLLAGKIMLQSGAETARVEDTMGRIAQSLGGKESHNYVTPTAIIFSIESDQPTKTKLIRITERTTDLHKVTLVNSISRKISNGELTLEESFSALKEVETSSKYTYSILTQVSAAAIASGCFLIMFKGSWYDFLPAFIAGGAGLLSVILFVFTGWGFQLDKIIIGSVMPLVPGLLLTNAVRDLMTGHLVSGISKGAEALLTAVAIGSGIAVVLAFI